MLRSGVSGGLDANAKAGSGTASTTTLFKFFVNISSTEEIH